MAGKPRLDMIEDRIARLERAQGEDVIDTFLRSLTDQQFAQLKARLEAGEDPVAALKEIAE